MVPGQKQDRAFFIIATVYSSAVLCTRLFFWLLSVWRKEKRRKINTIEEPENMDEVLRLWRTEDTSSEFSLYDFSQIADATDNFSPKSKLGEGGFGPVYKGVFPDGQELAIKRLSARSQQGLIEFKNEIQVITKLQHRNLVRLLGCCIHGEEKMLVYEYLTNKSLDHFIFDPIRRASLKWKMRIKIVEGYSRQMPLKQQQADLWAHYVFSFGVLLLEIISGKRSSGFQYNGEFYNLLEPGNCGKVGDGVSSLINHLVMNMKWKSW
ncbi:cysteine-rich receptor-like protein kinase 26 isoform X6 [Setaria viridis]|uniref:cysteine-rich receptor-like protein kinase 26 isoform X6 n=1 Tax=Setaria viridis TaxID=4556 RepID=UPI003B3A80DD